MSMLVIALAVLVVAYLAVLAEGFRRLRVAKRECAAAVSRRVAAYHASHRIDGIVYALKVRRHATAMRFPEPLRSELFTSYRELDHCRLPEDFQAWRERWAAHGR